jgi:hypothetical protein
MAQAKAPSVPSDLLLELTLSSPEAFYLSLIGLSGASPRLPGNWEPVVAALLGFPRGVAERLDAAGPILGVWAGKPEAPVFVLAAHVMSGAEVVALLSAGADADWEARQRADGVVVLARRDGGGAAPVLAVVDDFVLSASSVEALDRAGTYVARGLARGERKSSGLHFTAPKSALAGAMRSFVSKRWQVARAELELGAAELQRTSGRKADFAEPSAILSLLDAALASLLDIVASSQSLAIAVVPHAERLEVTLDLEPDARGAAWERASTLRTGDLAPLESLPASAALAALWRPGNASAEPSDGTELPGATARALFGSRLSPADAEKLSAFFAKAGRAAPETRALALLTDRTFVYRERVLPGGAATDLRGAVALLELPAIGEPFAALYGKSEPAWESAPSSASLAAGPSARTAVASERSGAEKSARLALEPSLRARHEPSAFALYAELSRLGIARADAPMLLSLTRRSRAISLRFELSRGASTVLLERTLLR